MKDEESLGNTALLLRLDLDFNADEAYALVKKVLLDKL